MSHLVNQEIDRMLREHKNVIEKEHMRNLFTADPNRFDKFSVKLNDIFLDYSKNLITEDTMNLLVKLATQANLKEWIEKMFTGEKINFTEGRAVLHTALRAQSTDPVYVDGHNILPDIIDVRSRMREFVNKVHSGEWKGYSGKKIKNIVNIGIGGSHLGPEMVCKALKPYSQGFGIHFIANIDGSDLVETLMHVDPDTTLFVVASKSFTTQETMTNANSAKDWFVKNGSGKKEDIAKHFIALSTNEKACNAFGIDSGNMYEFWDWVGGRYSMWSAIGMSIALYIGWDNFEEFLAGAYEMDQHFRNTGFERNIPVILALLGIWYNNYWAAQSHAIIPYDYYLERFPAYMQQLDMESNGKRINRQGELTKYFTGPIIWGEPGTNAQHSFFQLLHQSKKLIAADFLAPIENQNNVDHHHDILLANFFAQTEALMKGKTTAEAEEELTGNSAIPGEAKSLALHKTFTGNKPSNTIIYKKLTPYNLGSLIAMYEHKVFTQGIIWDINSFDQWGVELGKQLAKKILPELLDDEQVRSHDASTNGLINYYKEKRNKKETVEE